MGFKKFIKTVQATLGLEEFNEEGKKKFYPNQKIEQNCHLKCELNLLNLFCLNFRILN